MVRRTLAMDAPFVEVTTTLSLDLHPSKLRNVKESVIEELGKLVLSYQADLQGIVLAYSGAKVVTRGPLVHTFFPYFHIDATAKLSVLKLLPGRCLGACRSSSFVPSRPFSAPAACKH